MSYSKPSAGIKFSSDSSSKMPPMNDLLKIAGFTMIPVGVMIGGWSYYDAKGKASKAMFEALKKPSWAVTNECNIAAIDFATMLPMGYALFLVTEHGTASQDVKQAVTAFGATMGIMALWTVAFTGSRNLQCWAGASAAVAASAGITASLFGKVNQTAGWLMVPFVAWSTFGTIQWLATYCKNRAPTLKKETL